MRARYTKNRWILWDKKYRNWNIGNN